MNGIIELIGQATKGSAPEALLAFQNFRIEESRAKGGQGTVFLAKHLKLNNKNVAIKFYKPEPGDDRRIANFKRETDILAALSHKNIVGIFAAGSALYDENQKCWHVREGDFNTKQINESGFVFFYVMQYIETSVADIFPIASLNFDPKKDQKVNPDFANEKLALFEELVRSSCDAVAAIHKAEEAGGIIHRDIKADNILYSRTDKTFRLADFGQARHVQTVKDEIFRNWPHNDPKLLKAGMIKEHDISQLALLFWHILEILEDSYEPARLNSIRRILDNVINWNTGKDCGFPFAKAAQLKEALTQNFTRPDWTLRLQQGEFLIPPSQNRNQFVFTGRLRIPIAGSILVTPEVEEIIDVPEFQRLRGVKQLGPTAFVFPGAYHTRFEHSIGAYSLSLRYLERLTRNPLFGEICQDRGSAIKATVLAALLHDIGHYPYSHWIEEIGNCLPNAKFQDHEKRAAAIIETSKLKDLIEQKWEIKFEVVTRLIARQGDSASEQLLQSDVTSLFRAI